MELKVSNAIFLSKQSNNEAKVASLIIGVQIYEKNINISSDEFVKEVFICQLVTNCGIEFLRDLASNSKCERIQEIGVGVLTKLISIPHILQKFCQFDQMICKIIQLYLSTADDKFLSTNGTESTLLLLLQSLVGSAPHETVRVVIQKLLSESTSQQNRTVEVLELIYYCSACLESTNTDPENLSSSHASALRSLFVQGLHGASPSINREHVFACLASLLQVQSLALNPCWTIESDHSGTNSGNFARFLGSLVAGELHLWVEECLEEPIQSDGKLDLQTKRRELVHSMIGILLGLVDSMQFLLVGSHDEVDEDCSDGVWASLPSSILLQIQTNLHHCIAECFDFIKWSATQQNKHQLEPLVTKSAQTFCSWIAEDDQLHLLFPTQLDVLLRLCVGHDCLAVTRSHRSVEELCSLHQSVNKLSQSDQLDDVALFLFPCILAVFGTALESDEVLAERLLGATNLFSVAVHTACICLSGPSQYKSNELDILFESSCDLIECILELKRTDILSLVPAEGPSAIGYVLGYDIEPFLAKCLHKSLNNVQKASKGEWSPLIMRVSNQLLSTLEAFVHI